MGVVTTEVPTRVSRVLVVDDHPIVREGLALILGREPDLAICGQAAGLSQALQIFHEESPDLVIVDLSLQNGSGLELIKELAAQDQHVRILVHSMHDESLYAERALRAGAHGYINKRESIAQILAAVRRVLEGRVSLSDRMTDRMLCRTVGGTVETTQETPIDILSDRELEVFDLIGRGITTRQIAEKLHLSPKTVETYRENIKAKLNLQNATELTQHAVLWVMESAT